MTSRATTEILRKHTQLKRVRQKIRAAMPRVHTLTAQDRYAAQQFSAVMAAYYARRNRLIPTSDLDAEGHLKLTLTGKLVEPTLYDLYGRTGQLNLPVSLLFGTYDSTRAVTDNTRLLEGALWLIQLRDDYPDLVPVWTRGWEAAVANVLEQLRREHGVSHRQLVHYLNLTLSKDEVIAYETDRDHTISRMSLSLYHLYATAFNLTPTNLHHRIEAQFIETASLNTIVPGQTTPTKP